MSLWGTRQGLTLRVLEALPELRELQRNTRLHLVEVGEVAPQGRDDQQSRRRELALAPRRHRRVALSPSSRRPTD